MVIEDNPALVEEIKNVLAPVAVDGKMYVSLEGMEEVFSTVAKVLTLMPLCQHADGVAFYVFDTLFNITETVAYEYAADVVPDTLDGIDG